MDGTIGAVVLILGRNRHELLVRVLLLWRIIRLALLEVWSKSYVVVSDVEHSCDSLCFTFPAPTFVTQRFPESEFG